MDVTTARQFWIASPGHGEIRSAPLPARAGDELLIRAAYSAVSRGTESLVFLGEVPPSQYQVMRAPFQEGAFPAPVKYGYSSVGRVEAAPPDSHLKGRLVFCLFPHQDLYCVPAGAVVPVPEGVPAGRAVLAANLETAINVVWDAGTSAGDRVIVVGGGVLGLLAAWLCGQMPGATVTVIDVNPARAAVAHALGVSFQADVPRHADADVVIHASGHPEGLASALSVAGLESTIVEASWFGTRTVPLPLGEAFHSRRLTLKSSQVGRLPASRAARWTLRRRLALALELLADERLDALLTGESLFDELPEVMASLSRQPGNTLCHRVRYAPL